MSKKRPPVVFRPMTQIVGPLFDEPDPEPGTPMDRGYSNEKELANDRVLASRDAQTFFNNNHRGEDVL